MTAPLSRTVYYTLSLRSPSYLASAGSHPDTVDILTYMCRSETSISSVSTHVLVCYVGTMLNTMTTRHIAMKSPPRTSDDEQQRTYVFMQQFMEERHLSCRLFTTVRSLRRARGIFPCRRSYVQPVRRERRNEGRSSRGKERTMGEENCEPKSIGKNSRSHSFSPGG